MTPGSTTANESNNASSISGSASVDTKNQIANLTVDLRDTNNLQISNLPITVAVNGPGLIGIGSTASTNNMMGRAVLGQPGQYSISVYADGTYGTSTIMIYQNGQLIGSRSIIFTQPVAAPPSVSFSDISISTMTANAGDSVRIQFTTKTTSLATGQEAYVSINSYEDCEVEGCSVGGPAKLVSGDSSNGTWLSALTIPPTAVSGEYTISIYFPKLKGVKDFFYRHPSRITIKGVDPTPPAPAPSIVLGQITLNKNEFKIGETLIVRIPVKTSNLPTGILLNATIFTADDCEDSNCSSGGTGKLVSGSLQDGVWEIGIPIYQGMYSGTYSMNYGFFKLKGASGAIGPLQSNIIKIVGVEPPPPAPPISIRISNISPKVTTINAGQTLDVSFEIASSNLDSSQIAQVYLFPTNGDDACEEGCGLGVAKLVSGSLSKGIWSASFLIPSTIASSNYSLRVAFPKLKGVPGFYADYSGEIKVLGSNQPAINPYYNFSDLRISTTQAKVGQVVEGYFSLKSNDDKISTPACAIDGVVGFEKASLISGATMSGNWVCRVLIPSTAITGSYRLQVAVVGYANNNKNEERADLGPIFVTGTPFLNVFYTIDATRLSTSEAKVGQSVQGYFSLKTNDENVYTPECKLIGVSEWVRATRLSGTAMSGSWVCTVQVPTTAISGLATFQVVVIGPANNNKNEERVSIGSVSIQGSTPQVEVGSIDIQSISEKTLGITTISFAYQANSGVAKIECSVSIGVCVVRDNGNSSSGQTYFGLAEVRNYSPGVNIDLSLRQYGSSGKMVASIQQPFSTLKPALQPRISAVTSIVGGCTFKILNYDPAFNWFAKSEMRVLKDGTATIKTLVTTDEYISTSRPGYQSINALNTLFRCVPLSQTQTDEPDEIIEDDGVEEEPVGDLRVRKESSGKFLMTITSNLDTEKISIVATRKGKATIRFSATTKAAGSVQIRTSRNLSGYTLRLIFDGATLKTTKVG
jgi:hypothetical protein